LEDEKNLVHLTLKSGDFKHDFIVTYGVFYSCDESRDFAVLKLPKDGFTMQRISVGLDVSHTFKVNVFYCSRNIDRISISCGEVSGYFWGGLIVKILCADRFSGAAIIVKGSGEAIGYIGGSYESRDEVYISYHAFRFDSVLDAASHPSGKRNYHGAKALNKKLRHYIKIL